MSAVQPKLKTVAAETVNKTTIMTSFIATKFWRKIMPPFRSVNGELEDEFKQSLFGLKRWVKDRELSAASCFSFEFK